LDLQLKSIQHLACQIAFRDNADALHKKTNNLNQKKNINSIKIRLRNAKALAAALILKTDNEKTRK